MIYQTYPWGGGYTKSEVDALLNGKSDTSHTHTKSQITDFPSYGTTANTICEGNDLRLSDARTPTSHTHTKSEITDFPSLATVATSGSYNDLSNKPTIPSKTSDLTNDSGFLTSHQDLSGYVPRSGGAVMTGNLARTDTENGLTLMGGTGLADGSSVNTFGMSFPLYGLAGAIRLITNDGSNSPNMYMFPNGTWEWQGTACQLISDQRLKQQIAEIDDKLLDAWEDVDLVQFKYNDAVDQKGDNARLHTGYVVQQIDKACKEHNVDISAYGLYCHEDYPEETEEVEVTQDDGTTKKETKVIREASEHYSLRYTETLVVECAYLRRENTRLNDRLTVLEELFKQYITK